MIGFRSRIASAFLLITFAASCVAVAQQQEPAAKEASQVAERGFSSRIFDVKNRDPQSLVSVLSGLGSGVSGTAMTPNRDFKTLTVRDFPENLTSIEEALKRLDTPLAADIGLELRIHVFIGSNIEGAVNPHPDELSAVLKELQSTLAYKNYYLVNSQVHRVKNNADLPAISASGSSNISPLLAAQSNTPVFIYTYAINSIMVQPAQSGASLVQLNNFSFNTGAGANASVKTSVNMRDGEQVVVGTASFSDKALILVLSAKIIR